MTWDLFDQCPAKLLMCLPQCAFYHAPMPTVMKASSSHSLYPGAVSRCRCVARVQAPRSSHPQVDGVALQPVQGGVGLAHPSAGHLHCHPDALLSRFPPQRPGGGSYRDRIINQTAVKSIYQ